MSKPYDPTLKSLIEIDPAAWPALVGKPAGPTAVIDADLSTVSGAADKVLSVAADPPHLLHLEFVAGHDSASRPRKLHARNVLLEDRHDREVFSAALLLRPEADSPRLTGEHTRALRGERPYLTFRFGVVRVWRLPPGPLLRGGPALFPLAPISAVSEPELPGIIERIRGELGGRRNRPVASTVWAAAFILFGMRHSAAMAQRLFEGVVTMEESTTYQLTISRGKALGEAEGRAQGRVEGAVEEARKVLRMVGDAAFGPPPARTAAAIDRITDLARLEAMLARIRQANNWPELLGPTRPRRG